MLHDILSKVNLGDMNASSPKSLDLRHLLLAPEHSIPNYFKCLSPHSTETSHSGKCSDNCLKHPCILRLLYSMLKKLVYLQQALKNCKAKGLVSNLLPSVDQYLEAVSCLKDDQPRLIIQAHISALPEYPTSKEGSNRELRRLYDVWLNHTHALKVLGTDLYPAYLTTISRLSWIGTPCTNGRSIARTMLSSPSRGTYQIH